MKIMFSKTLEAFIQEMRTEQKRCLVRECRLGKQEAAAEYQRKRITKHEHNKVVKQICEASKVSY